MALRFTPRKTSFYEMFAASAANLVVGVSLLTELLERSRTSAPASVSA